MTDPEAGQNAPRASDITLRACTLRACHDMAPAAWGALVPAGAALSQSATYGTVATGLGRAVERWQIAGPQAVAWGTCQILRRRGLRVILRGPAWDAQAPTDARLRRRVLGRLGRGLSVATPEEAASGPGLVPLMTPRFQARLALGPEDQMRAAMQGKWRNRLVKAEAEGLKVARLTGHAAEPELARLLALDSAQAGARGYRSLGAGFLAGWAAVAPKDLWLYLARGRGTADPLAMMLFLRHGDGATYHIGWSGVEGRQRHAHNLLLWRAMRDLAARGVHHIDLGDLDDERSPGLARFKLGCGAMPQKLGPTLWVIAPLARL
ncbi:GNAT family N-acetyltransferase [Phaeovulum vinaykumarii]|uniref:Acetyltransferase (GNAT) domain-containing protein n=1 Tax=Phaeovulum vinaykumarii TaxID=407234 RepID=A0A1N7LHL2_9RHOB|nr:GNAT family N-acetyltransferase [Phaeovulum vinaykumarii]SIS73276.1 Acetyltransferase (GNAT) domain-containing protein [Phaeovulum vinaykumarii]SOC04657.1 acetyltransferase (GNAT) family protein [Phaeovulum vinaykumarii]